MPDADVTAGSLLNGISGTNPFADVDSGCLSGYFQKLFSTECLLTSSLCCIRLDGQSCLLHCPFLILSRLASSSSHTGGDRSEVWDAVTSLPNLVALFTLKDLRSLLVSCGVYPRHTSGAKVNVGTTYLVEADMILGGLTLNLDCASCS